MSSDKCPLCNIELNDEIVRIGCPIDYPCSSFICDNCKGECHVTETGEFVKDHDTDCPIFCPNCNSKRNKTCTGSFICDTIYCSTCDIESYSENPGHYPLCPTRFQRICKCENNTHENKEICQDCKSYYCKLCGLNFYLAKDRVKYGNKGDCEHVFNDITEEQFKQLQDSIQNNLLSRGFDFLSKAENIVSGVTNVFHMLNDEMTYDLVDEVNTKYDKYIEPNTEDDILDKELEDILSTSDYIETPSEIQSDSPLDTQSSTEINIQEMLNKIFITPEFAQLTSTVLKQYHPNLPNDEPKIDPVDS